MAVKANVLLKTIGEKLGLSADQITKLVGNPSLESVDIDDDVAIKITNTEVFTADSAASDGKIRAKIKAELYNGVDAHARTLAIKHGLSEDELKEFDEIKLTNDKLEKVYDKIAEKQRQLAETSGKAKNALEKDIEKLNGQVTSVKQEYELKIQKLNSERQEDRVNWEKSSLFKSLDLAVPEGVEKSDYEVGAQAILDNKLRSKGVKFKLNDQGILEPYNAADDTRYYDNNVALSSSDLIKKLANEAKILKVSDGGSGNGSNGNGTPQPAKKKAVEGLNLNIGALEGNLQAAVDRDFGG